MKLVYNPLTELNEVQHRLNKLFAHNISSNSLEEDLKGSEWTPLVDIVENEKEFLIKAELPALKKEEIRVSLEKNILRIAGERHAEKEEMGKKFHRIERSYGSFSRSFTIPDVIDESKVTADFNDGLLVLHLPKSEKAKEKRIEININ